MSEFNDLYCFERAICFILYGAVHFMLVIICLNDSYLCFWGFHRLHCAYTLHTSISRAKMLHSCSIYHICVLSLSIVQFALISLTYLDLIKLMFVSCGFCTWFSAVWLFFCRCLAVPLEEKTLSMMFHHPLFQNGLTVQLKTQTVKDSGLYLIHIHTLASFRMLLL